MATPTHILTDTHTHIYYNIRTEKMQEQIDRCKANNITRLFLPNVDVESIDLISDSIQAYPENCYAMLGLHPCSVKEDYLEQLSKIQEASKNMPVYAIGEIGMDLYWDTSTKEWQQEAFKLQIQWAKSLDLPINIHCREAFDETFEILEELKDEKLRGIFHCFTGNLEQAHRAINLGFKLGIGGVVTFKKAGLDKVVKEIDLEHIVLETDSPYLAPSPYRGKENESSYLLYVAQKVADLHEISLEKVADITTKNSIDIFGI